MHAHMTASMGSEARNGIAIARCTIHTIHARAPLIKQNKIAGGQRHQLRVPDTQKERSRSSSRCTHQKTDNSTRYATWALKQVNQTAKQARRYGATKLWPKTTGVPQTRTPSTTTYEGVPVAYIASRLVFAKKGGLPKPAHHPSLTPG